MGGGGYISGLSIAPDGTKAIRTDTYGGYVFDASLPTPQSPAGSWRQVLTSTSMPAGSVNVDLNNAGLFEIVVCPSLTSRLYMIPADGLLYRSDDTGKTWTQKPAFAAATVLPNAAPPKAFGRFMAVDPQNPDILYVGTPSQGMFVTTNGGTSFSSVAAVGTASGPGAGAGAGGNIIAFDPSSSVSGGKKQGIFVSTYGVGVYHSTNGGTSWTLLNTAGMPTTHMHLVVDQNGKAWVVKNASGANISTWTSGGGWVANSVSDGLGLASVAIDPANANNVITMSVQGFLYLSTDGGSTWGSGQSFVTNIGGDQVWFTGTNISNPGLSSADIQYDPSQSGIAYITTGGGIFFFNPTVNGLSSVSFTSQVSGIEEVVSVSILAPPGGADVVGGSEDFPAWHWSSSDFNLNRSAALPGYVGPVPPNVPLLTGMCFDYANNNSKFVVGMICGNVLESSGVDHSGYSSDGGATWTEFAAKPAIAGNTGGNIAASSNTNFVWAGAYAGSNIYFTTNGGASWTQSTGLSNITFAGGFNVTFRYLAADKVSAGTFYLYVPATNTGNDGVWKSTNSGSSFSKVHAGSLDSLRDGGSKCFKCNPSVAGDLWFTPGYQQGSVHPVAMSLYRSTDAGVTWNAVAGFQETFTLGFGATIPSQSYCAICVVGWRSNVFGFWESRDNGATWTSIGDYPNGWFRNPADIDGDKTVLGQWYAAINGAGFRRYGA